MWPWGHAAVAFVVLWMLARVRALGRARANDASPSLGEFPGMGRRAIVAVLVGSQLPDLVDKPLAWELSVLPTGRSLGHSLLFAVPVIAVVLVVARRRERAFAGVAFGVGYLTGILTDVPGEVFSGEFSRATFLVYPLLPLPAYDQEPSLLAHLGGIDLTTAFLVQVAVGALVAVLALWEYGRSAPGS